MSANNEVEPVFTDAEGKNYYFGTPERPFNIHPNVCFPMVSLEIERAHMQGGLSLAPYVSKDPPPADTREYIESENRRLRTS